jgi:hypothetical protein
MLKWEGLAFMMGGVFMAVVQIKVIGLEGLLEFISLGAMLNSIHQST